MARTIKLYAPTGWATVTVQLFDETDTEIEEVAMTEATTAKGIYRGTVTAAPGTYDAVVSGNSGGGKVSKGAYGYVRLVGDPEVAVVGDAHGVPDGVKLGKEIQRDNISGDQLTETLSET